MGAGWYLRLERFVLVDGEPGISFYKRGTSVSLRRKFCGRSLSLRSQAVSKKPKKQFRRHAAMEAAGMNGYQGTPWSEELDGKELDGAERLDGGYDLEPREQTPSCTSQQKSTQLSRASTNVALCWF